MSQPLAMRRALSRYKRRSPDLRPAEGLIAGVIIGGMIWGGIVAAVMAVLLGMGWWVL